MYSQFIAAAVQQRRRHDHRVIDRSGSVLALAFSSSA
jgi:hypothetical protein